MTYCKGSLSIVFPPYFYQSQDGTCGFTSEDPYNLTSYIIGHESPKKKERYKDNKLEKSQLWEQYEYLAQECGMRLTTLISVAWVSREAGDSLLYRVILVAVDIERGRQRVRWRDGIAAEL